MPAKISVITICYENPAELRVTLLSTIAKMAQLHHQNDVEIIVVDGSNSSKCALSLKDFRNDNISYMKQRGIGVYDAMNFGVEHAHGDTVLFMNSGDVFACSFDFKVLLGDRQGALSGKIFFGDCYYKVENIYIHELVDQQALNWWRNKLPCHQSTFIPRSFLQTHPFNSSQKINADAPICRRAFDELDHEYIGLPVAVFELGGASNNANSLGRVRTLFAEISANRQLKIEGKAKLLCSLLLRYCLIKIFGFKNYILIGRLGLPK